MTEGFVLGVITQNVDRLHQAAGSTRVVDLHGRLDRVVCLGCSNRLDRRWLQEELDRLNPNRKEDMLDNGQLAPDGDAEVDDDHDFEVPACTRCEGVLKPDVVFFGENVPRPRVETAFYLLDHAEALLVLGSSLAIRSALRFVDRAQQVGIPILIVNRGPTRADDSCDVRIDAGLADALPLIVDRVSG